MLFLFAFFSFYILFLIASFFFCFLFSSFILFILPILIWNLSFRHNFLSFFHSFFFYFFILILFSIKLKQSNRNLVWFYAKCITSHHIFIYIYIYNFEILYISILYISSSFVWFQLRQKFSYQKIFFSPFFLCINKRSVDYLYIFDYYWWSNLGIQCLLLFHYSIWNFSTFSFC